MYSKRENPDQVPKFLTEDFKKIIRAAKRIERLVVGISEEIGEFSMHFQI